MEYESPRYTGQRALDTGAGGWTKHWDDTHQAEFYYNSTSGETSWERPVNFVTPRPGQESTLSVGWSKFWDDVNQMEYYYNAVSVVLGCMHCRQVVVF
jgi:GH18 family chitinase